jgi:hypothetical protein
MNHGWSRNALAVEVNIVIVSACHFNGGLSLFIYEFILFRKGVYP